MGIIYSDKSISKSKIGCGGTFSLNLTLTAQPNIQTNPADIVLVLDRSGSMSGTALEYLKSGAKRFIEIIDSATDSKQNREIGCGSRIGIVSFSNKATADSPLTTSVAKLEESIDALTADGLTNHADAFSAAIDMFPTATRNKKIIVMFTDGKTTVGDLPEVITNLAKAGGIIIYCIGLTGDNGISISSLNQWASDPDSAYVYIIGNEQGLEKLFEDLAANISKTGATNIVLRDTISDCFEVTGIEPPAVGEAKITDGQNVEWKICKLGTTASEGATLKIFVRHRGKCIGTLPVNKSVSYCDSEKNEVTFPSPEIEVSCDITVIGEPCPDPVEIPVPPCKDSIEYNAGEITLMSAGHIIELEVTIKDVCPGKRVALAVMLTETDTEGVEHRRGLKTLSIPAHNEKECTDITVKCIKFIVPEDNNDISLCNGKKFNARFFAHYTDSDFGCCQQIE